MGTDRIQSGSRGSLWRRLKKRVRHGYVRLLRSPGAPDEIAGGLSVGLFIAMLPVIQMPLAVGVTELLRRAFRMRLSRIAAAAGVWITNPLTGPMMYGGAFFVGRPFARMLLPEGRLADPAVQFSLHDLAGAGPFALEAIVALLLGGVVLGLPLSLAGFFVSRAVVRRYQQRRAARLAQRAVLATA